MPKLKSDIYFLTFQKYGGKFNSRVKIMTCGNKMKSGVTFTKFDTKS